MSMELKQVAEEFRDANKKVQFIYAFNGVGKTHLSRVFKDLVTPEINAEEKADRAILSREKILYYNASTEDRFYWDNNLEKDGERKLMIQPNRFTDWILLEPGQDQNVIANFQRLTNDRLTPSFNQHYRIINGGRVHYVKDVTFSIETGDGHGSRNIKISKGEESNFVWVVFFTLLEQVTTVLDVSEPNDCETDQFNDLEYVFIDDPVSSLDENHLIQLAVEVANLNKKGASGNGLKFIITTHNPLFYNVLFSELKRKICYLLKRFEDGKFDLETKDGAANKIFSYHLYLKQPLEQAIAADKIERYHFTLLRNLYEKTSSFLGYPQWSQLLPGDQQLYWNRIMQFTSDSRLSSEAVAAPSPPEKQTIELLLEHLCDHYRYWQEGAFNG